MKFLILMNWWTKALQAVASWSHSGSTITPQWGKRFYRLTQATLALVVLATSVTSALAAGPFLTGSCGCVRRDPVECESLHNCIVPRYRSSATAKDCDHIRGTRANNRINCTIDFPLVAGPKYLWDADLQVIAQIASTTTRINYGTRRMLNNTPMVMAWSVLGTDGVAHTGWIPVSYIAQDMSWMPTEAPATPSAPSLEGRLLHTVRNRSHYFSADGQPLKVTTDCTSTGQKATDYLDKDGGRAVQVYNTPGWGGGSPTMDIVRVDTGRRFMRDRNIVHVTVSLYDCSSGTAAYSGKSLWFLYGYIEGVSPPRYGWMAYPLMN